MLKLFCDIVPEVAKGQGAEEDKGLYGMGEQQCYCTCIWTSLILLYKGQISLSRTIKLHTLANACRSQEGKTPWVKNFQTGITTGEMPSKYEHQLLTSKSCILKF